MTVLLFCWVAVDVEDRPCYLTEEFGSGCEWQNSNLQLARTLGENWLGMGMAVWVGLLFSLGNCSRYHGCKLLTLVTPRVFPPVHKPDLQLTLCQSNLQCKLLKLTTPHVFPPVLEPDLHRVYRVAKYWILIYARRYSASIQCRVVWGPWHKRKTN